MSQREAVQRRIAALRSELIHAERELAALDQARDDDFNAMLSQWKREPKCGLCNGTGLVDSIKSTGGKAVCAACHGTGKPVVGY